jgi:hypothetical protein
MFDLYTVLATRSDGALGLSRTRLVFCFQPFVLHDSEISSYTEASAIALYFSL